MRNTHRYNIMIAGFLLFYPMCLLAQDWPQWRGVNRDGMVSGFIAPKKWPGTLKQKWTTMVGQGDATPALVGNTLFVFTRQDNNEVILCLDARNGSQVWRDSYEVPDLTGPAASHPGPRSSPCVADGKMITLGATGIISCLTTDSGKIIWRTEEYTKILPPYYTAMSPIIVNGTCIAHLGGAENGEIIAFDMDTGIPKWKWQGDGPAYNSPALMTVDSIQQVVVLTEQNLVGLAINDGKLLWQVPAPTVRMFFNSASPVINEQTIILTGQGTGTKGIKIAKNAYGFIATEIWNARFGTAFNTPLLKDDMIFGLTDRGYPFCLNAQTGEQLWIAATKLDRFGAIVDLGSVLLLLPSTSEFIFIDPSDTEYCEMFRFKVSNEPIYSHPVIAGNRIYIKNDKMLTLWTIE